MTNSNGIRAPRLYRSIVARTMALSTVAFLGTSTAYPHDSKRPELTNWFKNLKNKAGKRCCDSGDGQHAAAEWDMAKGGYKVMLRHPHRPTEPGQWFDVPASVVIDQPNLSGVAMVWWFPIYNYRDGSMTPELRCFIPGPAG
jgi:hypothetical protein